MSDSKTLWTRLYALLLRSYPASIGPTARAEMRQVFAEIYDDRCLRRGRLSALGFALRACAEIGPLAIKARRDARSSPPASARTTRSGPATSAMRGIKPPIRPNRPTGGFSEMIDRAFGELRYALRTFRANPGYFAVVVLTLAVGIGANTAIFSVVKGVLLDTLPYAEPERIASVWQYELDNGNRGRMTPGNFVDVRDLADVFDGAAAFGISSATLLGSETPELITGGRVSADYFDVLGIQPVVGRAFNANDETVGGPDVIILGEELWDRRFAADPEILGQTVNLDGRPFEVVGVLPRGVYPTYATVNGTIPFTPNNHDFLVPLRLTDEFYANRRSHVLGVIARLGENVTMEQAGDAVDALAASIAEQYPIVAGEGFRVDPLADEILGGTRMALMVLMGTVAVVLIIAVINVAGLMLARADARHAETTVRAALGAGRWTLVRQSVVESLLLAATGAAAGIAVAYAAIDTIKGLVPFQIPRMNEVTLDLPVLAFAIAVAVTAGVALGVAPAILATRSGMLSQLRQGARGLTADGGRRRTHGVMVAAQACMAVMLVVGAGLLVRTFVHIKRIDPGFSAAGVVAVPISLPQSRYPTSAEVLAFFDRTEAALVASPGVASVAFGYDHPLRKGWGDGFRIENRPPPADGERFGASFRPVTPGYIETVGIPLLRGRTFTRTDDADHPSVVVVNRAFAAQYFPQAEAVGQRIRIPTVERLLGDEDERWMEIVGVVGDVRFNGPTEAIEPAMYVSIPQVPMSDVVMLVEPEGDATNLAQTVRSTVWALDAELPLDGLRTLDTMLADAIGRERFNMLLVGLFATIALVLAGLGTYGLIARLVSMQSKEIGIRIALGAQRREILTLVLTGALTPVLLGGLGGLAGAAGLSRMVESLLYQVGTLDPLTYLSTPIVLVATALLASYLPARRALEVDPITALRQE